jgi:hypothetical protein
MFVNTHILSISIPEYDVLIDGIVSLKNGSITE